MRPITKAMMCAFAAAAMAAPSVAANYLKIGDVKSKSAADGGTAAQIQIKSWSWGASDDGRVVAGDINADGKADIIASPRDTAGLPTGKRQHKPLTISKPLDRGSVTVIGSLPGCTVGATYPDVVLQTTYIRYELKEVMISSCTVSGAGEGGGVPTESVTLNYDSYRESPTRASQK